ncbi:hypothetical protein [Sulfurospirillum arcachonense]|uniref:hypothetical protein n=1 Tax=Sulfurospirillum arcachonense TaxID=57666 RepID=UPI000469051F|nr:hypothetical protein [Sulfurospirillum arcachonense]
MKKIAIFGHDAGGSELLIELLKASLHVGEFKVFCEKNSPCYNILKQKNLTKYLNLVEPSKKFVFQKLDKLNPDMVLYSTGWQNHTEYHFLSYAKKHKIPSIAFLDNWTNYRERFGYPASNWKKKFPDYIATHDETSEKLASSFGLPNLISIKNYALINQLENFKKTLIKQEDTLLFLSEPTAKVAKKTFNDPYYWGFDESNVFQSILKHKKEFNCDKIVVRLHPSDIADTYTNIEPNISISTASLEEDIARAKVIIGIDSSVLYLAFLLGKKTIAFVPSTNRDFHVPLPKANQICTLENLNMNSIIINKKNTNNYGMEFASFIKRILG